MVKLGAIQMNIQSQSVRQESQSRSGQIHFSNRKTTKKETAELDWPTLLADQQF